MPEDLNMEVGRLGGRLTAIEARQDRVDDKLDTMDAKLDTLLAAAASRNGVGEAVKWLATLLVGASGWLYTLLHLTK